MKFLFTGLAMLSTALFLHAQAGESNPRGTSLGDTLEIHPLTVVALHPQASGTETLKLTSVDQMSQDGGALLNRIPAFSSIRKSGAYGFDPVFRGFKYEQLNVVLNGAQSATAACPNRMDPPTSQLAPNMIQEVKVLKGPHALRYGCSFGATINFIPVAPRYSEEREVYGRLSGAWESNGNILRSEGMAGFSGKKYDLGLFASWSQGQDYLNGNAGSVQSDFLKGSFGGQLGLQLAEKQVLTLNATRNLARDVDFAALPMDLRSDDTWMFSATHEASPKREHLHSWKSTLYGSFVDHLMDNYSKPLDPRTVNADTHARTRNYGGRSEGSWHFDQARLYAGADLKVEGAVGSRTREFLMGPNAGKVVSDNAWQDGQITRSGIFAEYHHYLGGIRWVLSGRLEGNVADVADADEAFAIQYPDPRVFQLNPGLSAGGKKSFGRHFSTGLWLGRAYRSGSLTERFINFFPVGQDPYEMLGNPLLDPEINNQADLQFQWKAQGTLISFDLFASFLQDAISSAIDTTLRPRLPSSPGVRRYTNLERAFKAGFELAWAQQLIAGMQQQFSLAYTYGQDLERKEALPEIAPLDLRYRLEGTYLDRRLNPWINFRHVLAQNRVSLEYGETHTPAFSLLDLGVSFRVLENLSLAAAINNLLDATYYEHLNRAVRDAEALPIYAPGRSILLSFSLDFR